MRRPEYSALASSAGRSARLRRGLANALLALASITLTVSALEIGFRLAIVRHVVELHGGTLLAHSGGICEGATVRVTIPLARPSERSGQSDGTDRLAV